MYLCVYLCVCVCVCVCVTLYHVPYIQNHIRYAIHPAPYILKPDPFALNPESGPSEERKGFRGQVRAGGGQERCLRSGVCVNDVFLHT